MTIYLKSDVASSIKIKAKKITFDNALHNFAIYGEDGTITMVDLANTHIIYVYEN